MASLSTRPVSPLLLALFGPVLLAQPIPSPLAESMRTNLKAHPDQLKRFEAGSPVAFLVETGSPDDVMLVGASRIWATPAYFVEQFKDITKFESAPGILAGRKFSVPPQESDLDGFHLTRQDVDELRACRPGNCSFKIGATGLQTLQKNVDWSSPDYVDLANHAVKSLWLEYLKNYQASGNVELARYQDTEKIFSVQKGLEDLIDKSSYLRQYVPELSRYLEDYPRAKLPTSEEFYYWQVGSFGLKPVHRLTHVIIFRRPTPLGDAYVIASKMLFASHYFRSALEVRFLIPGQDEKQGGMCYLVAIQRSYVDGLTGFRGRLIRGTILSRSRQSMESYIANAKQRVEKGFNK